MCWRCEVNIIDCELCNKWMCEDCGITSDIIYTDKLRKKVESMKDEQQCKYVYAIKNRWNHECIEHEYKDYEITSYYKKHIIGKNTCRHLSVCKSCYNEWDGEKNCE